MVVKMMKWRPWPPLMSKKFEVKLFVRRIEGVNKLVSSSNEFPRLMVEIRWKGSKVALSSLRRTVKNFTKEERVRNDGVVEWNEEFQTSSNLSVDKDNVFHPWEIAFTVFNVLNQGSKKKVSIVGTVLLNLAEYASVTEQNEFEINLPLILSGSCVEPHPSLCLSLNLLELRTAHDSPETVHRSISPAPSSPLSGEAMSPEKDEFSALKAGLRKVKTFKEYVSTRRSKKACHEGEDSEGMFSSRSEDAESTYPFDTESPDDFDEEELDDNKDHTTDRKSFSYGTLAHANCAGGLYYSKMRINGDYEDWGYYSNQKSDVGCLPAGDTTASTTDQSVSQSSKRSILSWRKRKLSFRSPKAKGEPLIKRSYGEEGGDDIDFDRRQLNSSDESLALGWHKGEDGSTTNRSSISEFGDDDFAVGSWEHKAFVNRDGHMKVLTQVFFASIDQRSERAAGESACTALVAVIADWFQTNQDLMPIKSQFDSLIRDGSLEWRNLCANHTYRERFPDKHFDLETVLQAKIRSLTVSSPKSFVGFFHPGGTDDGSLDFLEGAMSFDGIWDEISRTGSDCHSNGAPQVYIVSWNDHFFVLKVEPEAYYIIDTLGERLYEGCNQAYILKFDRETAIHSMPNEARSSAAKPASGDKQQIVPSAASPNESEIKEAKEEEVIVCKGKESCKEYIKSFLAAIPIRDLQVDIKKGLSTSVHSRLQIEFHYTELVQPTLVPDAAEATISPATLAADFLSSTPTPQAAEAAIAPVTTQVMLTQEVVAC